MDRPQRLRWGRIPPSFACQPHSRTKKPNPKEQGRAHQTRPNHRRLSLTRRYRGHGARLRDRPAEDAAPLTSSQRNASRCSRQVPTSAPPPLRREFPDSFLDHHRESSVSSPIPSGVSVVFESTWRNGKRSPPFVRIPDVSQSLNLAHGIEIILRNKMTLWDNRSQPSI